MSGPEEEFETVTVEVTWRSSFRLRVPADTTTPPTLDELMDLVRAGPEHWWRLRHVRCRGRRLDGASVSIHERRNADPANLTGTERAVLVELLVAPAGDCYEVSGGRGRSALVAPDGMGGHRRVQAFNWQTWRGLWASGLIEITEGRYVPVRFSGRVHLDSRDGRPVRVTDAGRAAIPPDLVERRRHRNG